MTKVKLIGLGLIGLLTAVALTFFLVGIFKPKVAGIYVETNPVSAVYINGEYLGRTPLRTTKPPNEVIVKLIPESFQKPLAPYETQMNLVAGVETVVKRDFGDLDETSAGEIVSFERVGSETSMVIVTIPDSAQVVIDGQVKTFAPYKTSSILPGEHTISISAEGYAQRTIKVKTHKDLKLTAVVQLAKTGQVEASEQIVEEVEQVETEENEMVEILSTPTGFLRVRSQPSSLGPEIGRVEPGQKFALLEVDERTGWFKIKYDEGKDGWISNQYAKKIEGSQSSPTPTPKTSATKSQTPTPTKIPTNSPTP